MCPRTRLYRPLAHLAAACLVGAAGAGCDDDGDDVNEPQPPAATTTTITADDPDPSEAGAPVTVQFTVTAANGTAPTGDVTVTDGQGASCSAPVSAGQCQLTIAAAGAVTLTATYPGNAQFAASSDTEEHTVQPAPAIPQQAAVEVGNIFFESNRNGTVDPAVDTVAVGGTVTWTWTNTGPIPHSVRSNGTLTFEDSPVQTGDGATHQATFAAAGTYEYDCEVHGPDMTGQVVVR
jgi:plastocyanin